MSDGQENLNNLSQLEQLGFDRRFQDQGLSSLKEDHFIGRVTEVHKKTYQITTGKQVMTASLSGRFSFHSKSRADYPTVGDWVIVQPVKNASVVRICDVLLRKSLLKRKDPGKSVKFQLIAANIDVAFVIQSVDANFDLNRLERYLVMVNESQIQPVVVLSKTDLIAADELEMMNDEIGRLGEKYPFLPISCLTGDGMEALKAHLKPRQTYCLLGSSGVGKTTLLNTLLGENLFDVTDVREKDSKGRHTTTKRQLICLDSGPIFIDTPGMRELGNYAIDAGLEQTFDDIASHGTQCRFNDCTHTHEKDCAVIAAVKQGVIDIDSYENFLKIQKESEFYETSQVAKRRKDRAFGKARKRFMKTSKKK